MSTNEALEAEQNLIFGDIHVDCKCKSRNYTERCLPLHSFCMTEYSTTSWETMKNPKQLSALMATEKLNNLIIFNSAWLDTILICLQTTNDTNDNLYIYFFS